MAIRTDNIGQSWLFPPSITDFVPENHICKLVVAVVDNVDVSDTEKKYKSGPGNPAYPRRMLLRLVVHASIDGVWSSRKIDRLAQENVIYMYLTGNEKPDFRTIALFKRENKDLIEETFKKTVAIAKVAGIMSVSNFSTDGTKIKANASKNNNVLSKEDLDWVKEIIEKGIMIDEEEDELYGDKRGDELPPDLNTKEKIQEKIKEIEELERKKLKSVGKKLIEKHIMGDQRQKERIERMIEKASEEIDKSGQDVVSLTDPEARFMKNKKDGKEPSYNPQITVDNDSGIIVANDVTQDCTDHDQLKPMVENTEKNVGELPEGTKMIFDNGFFNGPNLRYLEEKGLDGYIPDSKLAQEMKGKKSKDNPYSKDRFKYDEENDCFICPQDGILIKKGEYEYNGKIVYSYYGANCSQCPVRSECAGRNSTRIITSDEYESERRRMSAKMRSEEGRKEYKQRGASVEWPFGNIKQNLGLREFLTRGIDSVRMEHNLVCAAHNFIIIWNKLNGNVSLVKGVVSSPSGISKCVGKFGAFLRSRVLINLERLFLKVNC